MRRDIWTMQLQIFETLEMGMEVLLVKRIARNKRKPVFFDFLTVSTGPNWIIWPRI
jgi:hypothetical protein